MAGRHRRTWAAAASCEPAAAVVVITERAATFTPTNDLVVLEPNRAFQPDAEAAVRWIRLRIILGLYVTAANMLGMHTNITHKHVGDAASDSNHLESLKQA